MSGLTRTLVGASLVLSSLAGCGGAEEAVPPPASRPVKLFLVEGSAADAMRSFPGRIDAAQRAELAFRVAGQLQQMLVKEGEMVERGQVLARLDPADYELVFQDRKASFDNARSNFDRAKELIVDGNISKMDFDSMEAQFRSTSAALSQAKKDLEYTVLHSPFRGRIAERKVENFEDVLAKQTVFSLQAIEQLDVMIDLPESVVRMVRGDVKPEGELVDDEAVSTTRAFAQFEGRGEEKFPLRPKEIATKANEQTQTFRATFTMTAPKTFTVLPGMTANVTASRPDVDESQMAASFTIPAIAVFADENSQSHVWIVKQPENTVHARKVTTGNLSGTDQIEILAGIESGEMIAIAGVSQLREGMQVRPVDRIDY